MAYKYSKKPVVLWGDGYQRRELIYIDDFLDDMFSLLPFVKNDLINIGADKDFSIREFATIICEEAGVDPLVIRYDENAYVGAK